MLFYLQIHETLFVMRLTLPPLGFQKHQLSDSQKFMELFTLPRYVGATKSSELKKICRNLIRETLPKASPPPADQGHPRRPGNGSDSPARQASRPEVLSPRRWGLWGCTGWRIGGGDSWRLVTAHPGKQT